MIYGMWTKPSHTVCRIFKKNYSLDRCGYQDQYKEICKRNIYIFGIRKKIIRGGGGGGGEGDQCHLSKRLWSAEEHLYKKSVKSGACNFIFCVMILLVKTKYQMNIQHNPKNLKLIKFFWLNSASMSIVMYFRLKSCSKLGLKKNEAELRTTTQLVQSGN